MGALLVLLNISSPPVGGVSDKTVMQERPEQLRKAILPMKLTLSGIVIEESPVQLSKA